jgi:dTDP-4-dehydrorhamnose 3,5-epimerase
MSAAFDTLQLPLNGLRLLQRKPISDHRGYIERLFCAEELSSFIPGKSIIQINHTLTTLTGTVRGLHFQHPPYAETKMVTCLRGEVFDVAVDLRQGSPTLLHWHAEILSAENHKTLLIPEGFAHGFQTLTDNCEMLYLHSMPYNAMSEGGVNASDPLLAIVWPLPFVQQSRRDSAHPLLKEDFQGLAI